MSGNIQNVDEKERDKFDSLSSHWWDPKGALRTLHHVNPARLGYIEQAVNLQDKCVLDLGCGGGLLAESMARHKALVTGLDINASAIEIANLHKEQSGLVIEYVTGNAEGYAVHNKNRFDIITCMELLEHIPDTGSLIAACGEMLKPGGYLFLSTINRSAWSYMSAILATEYLLKLLPRGTHDYSRFIKPSELNKWLTKSGFTLVDLAGIIYVPGINKCSITSKPSVNYIACATLCEE